MQENEEFIRKTEERALQIGRLLQLISMDTNAIQRHILHNSPKSIIEQYVELRNEHLDELQELMRLEGLSIQLTPLDNVA